MFNIVLNVEDFVFIIFILKFCIMFNNCINNIDLES